MNAEKKNLKYYLNSEIIKKSLNLSERLFNEMVNFSKKMDYLCNSIFLQKQNNFRSLIKKIMYFQKYLINTKNKINEFQK